MKHKWWIPVISIVLFGVESIFTIFFPSHLIFEDWIFVPRFLFIFVLFLSVYYDLKLGVIYAFTYGVVIDIVFTEIYGIYMFWFPAIVYVVGKLMKVVHSHLVIMAIITMLSITVIDFGIYFFNYILQITSISIESFVNNRLYPTLILNFIFFVFFSYRLKKSLGLLQKEKEEEQGMFQS